MGESKYQHNGALQLSISPIHHQLQIYNSVVEKSKNFIQHNKSVHLSFHLIFKAQVRTSSIFEREEKVSTFQYFIIECGHTQT